MTTVQKNTFRTTDTTKPAAKSLLVLSSDLLLQSDIDSGLTTPTNASGSFQGFDVPYSRRIQRQANKRWVDLQDDVSSVASSFVTPSTQDTSAVPMFPTLDTNDSCATDAVADYEDEEEDDSTTSSPTASFVDSIPMKGDADGAEAFEEEEDADSHEGGLSAETHSDQYHESPSSAPVPPAPVEALPTVYQNQPYLPATSAPQYQSFDPYYQQQQQQQASYAYTQQYVQSLPPPPPMHAQSQPSTQPAAGGFQHHNHHHQQHYQQQIPQYQPQRFSPPPQPYRSSPQPQQQQLPNANYELDGWVSFIPYEKMVHSELPNAAAVGAGLTSNPKRTAKFFCGHMWGDLSSASLQWLVSKVVPESDKHRLFAPQLHFNKDGWFRGCLHVSVHSPNPRVLVEALHKRVLFDHNGVWYAETDEEKEVLATYCRKLRNLPQAVRHEKLQGLPCNPIALEFAANE